MKTNNLKISSDFDLVKFVNGTCYLPYKPRLQNSEGKIIHDRGVSVVISRLKDIFDRIIANNGTLTDIKITDIQDFIDYSEVYRFKYKILDGELVKDADLSEIARIEPWQWYLSYELINFLSESNRLGKLKKCPICQKFFIAKDRKRIICYEKSCSKERRRLFKQHQRKVDPCKYM